MKVITIHPFDPWGTKIGGIENVIRTFFRYTPPEMEHYLIGVTENPQERPINQWQEINFEEKPIHFFPIFAVKNPNQRRWFPLFLQFSLVLHRRTFGRFEDGVAFYHRIDPLAMGPRICKKNVFYMHSHPLEWIGKRSEVKWRYIPWAYHWIEKQAVKKSNKVLTVTQKSRDYFKEKYPQNGAKFDFAATGYRDTLFDLRSKQEQDFIRQKLSLAYSIPLSSIWLIFAARLEEQKNPLLAIESFAEVVKQEHQMNLLIAGEGYLLEDMRNKALSLGISNQVHFLGPLLAESLAELYAAGDIFLMTSSFEGMPVGALEALACGLPIVATDVGELSTMVQTGINGILVQKHSAEEISHALLKIINEKKEINEKKSFSIELCADSVRQYKAGNAIFFIAKELMAVGQ